MVQRFPRRGVAINPLHEEVERALDVCRIGMVDDRRERPAPSLRVDHVACDGAGTLERAGFEQPLPRDIDVLETVLDRSTRGGDGERRREFLEHGAAVLGANKWPMR